MWSFLPLRLIIGKRIRIIRGTVGSTSAVLFVNDYFSCLHRSGFWMKCSATLIGTISNETAGIPISDNGSPAVLQKMNKKILHYSDAKEMYLWRFSNVVWYEVEKERCETDKWHAERQQTGESCLAMRTCHFKNWLIVCFRQTSL